MNKKSDILCTLKSSDPIPIKAPSKSQNNSHYHYEISNHYSNEIYDLKLNIFDPNKSSPPNSWNSRLLNRLDTYSHTPY